jgi:hypothetical protein
VKRILAVALSASKPFSASDGEKVAEGRMRCSGESGERDGVRSRNQSVADLPALPKVSEAEARQRGLD